MTGSIYIIMSSRGIERTCKTDGFTLKPFERAFRLDVSVEDSAFASPPVPVVRMTVPAEALIREVTIEGVALPAYEEEVNG